MEGPVISVPLALIRAILERDNCRCDTSVCYWCRTDGWVAVSPVTIEKLKGLVRENPEHLERLKAMMREENA